MNIKSTALALAAALMLAGAAAAFARGMGGARGGGYGGGGQPGQGGGSGQFGPSSQRPAGGAGIGGQPTGAYRPAGENRPVSGAGGPYRGPDAAFGQNRVGVSEGGAYRAPGIQARGVGAVSLPTDAGFGVRQAGAGAQGLSRAGAARYATAGHRTWAYSGSVAAARGVAVRGTFNHYDLYRPGWYQAHPRAWFAAGWTAGRAWDRATWPVVGGWWGWPATVQPIYYNYGDNVTYQGDQVYVDQQPAATAEQYYQQAATLAASTPPSDPNGDNWMPLGVFALVQQEQANADITLQLAVDKAGAIAGNYCSVLTGTTLPIHGAVNKQTHLAAWTVGDNATTVYEAGISNLTQGQAPVLLHLGKDTTQQWLLVRLKEPSPTGGNEPAGPGEHP